MSYQGIESSHFGSYDLYNEDIFFSNTFLEILLDEKINIMTNVLPHHHDLYKKRKKAMLFINNPVFKEYNQIQ